MCTIVQMQKISKLPTKRADRRLLILNTTLRMIAAGGVDSVTHRRVADAAGIPLGSTTYYFDSREHLLQEAFEHYLDIARKLQQQVSAGRSVSNINDLVDLLVELTNREFEDEAMLQTEYEMTLFAARDPRVAKSLHAWDETMITDIAVAMESLGASHTKDGARTILHLMRGYELDCLTRHQTNADDLRRRLKVVVATLIG
ncbi:MAG: TetR family transcriptional regulator [Pseudomonadota bacterium]